MAKEHAPLVIYFDRRKIDVFVGDQNKVISWQLPESVFHHLEIMDAQGFRKLFEAAITANKIVPTKTIVVFSQNIVFGVELPSAEAEAGKREALLTQFREQVPFASPFVKEIKLEKTEMAIALNRDTFELLVAQLKSLGFEVTTLVTSHLVPFALPATGMTAELATEVIKVWPKLEENDFLEPEQKKGMLMSREEQNPKDKNRIFLLVGVFAVLLLILGGAIFMMVQQNNKDKAAAEEAKLAALAKIEADQAVATEPTPPPIAPPVGGGELKLLEAASPEVQAERAAYSVIIFEPSASLISGDDLETALKTVGFRTIRVVRNATTDVEVLTLAVGTSVSGATKAVLTG